MVQASRRPARAMLVVLGAFAAFGAARPASAAEPSFTVLPLSALGPDAAASRSSLRARAHEERLVLAWVERTSAGPAIMARPSSASAPVAKAEAAVVQRLLPCVGAGEAAEPQVSSLGFVAGRFVLTFSHCGASWLARSTDATGAAWDAPAKVHDGSAGATPAVVGAAGELTLLAWAEEDPRKGEARDGGLPPDPARRVIVRRLGPAGGPLGTDQIVWARGEVPSDDMGTMKPASWLATSQGPVLVVRFYEDMKGQYGHRVIRALDAGGTQWGAPETVWQYGVGNSRMTATSPIFEHAGGLAALVLSSHPAGHFDARLAHDTPRGPHGWAVQPLGDLTWSRPFAATSKEPHEPSWTFVTAAPAMGGARIALAAVTDQRGDGGLVVQTALGERESQRWKALKPKRISKKHQVVVALWMDVEPAAARRPARVRLLGLGDDDTLIHATLPLPTP